MAYKGNHYFSVERARRISRQLQAANKADRAHEQAEQAEADKRAGRNQSATTRETGARSMSSMKYPIPEIASAIDSLMMAIFKLYPEVREIRYICAEVPHCLGVEVRLHDGGSFLDDNLRYALPRP